VAAIAAGLFAILEPDATVAANGAGHGANVVSEWKKLGRRESLSSG
jgi:hypothetical protein